MVYSRCTDVACESWLGSAYQDACPELVLWITVYLVMVQDAVLVIMWVQKFGFKSMVFVMASKHDNEIVFFKRLSSWRVHRRTQVHRSMTWQTSVELGWFYNFVQHASSFSLVLTVGVLRLVLVSVSGVQCFVQI